MTILWWHEFGNGGWFPYPPYDDEGESEIWSPEGEGK